MLAPVDPLTGCIDLRVGLNGSHSRWTCNVNLTGLDGSRARVPARCGSFADGELSRGPKCFPPDTN